MERMAPLSLLWTKIVPKSRDNVLILWEFLASCGLRAEYRKKIDDMGKVLGQKATGVKIAFPVS
jgi:hypothetical protein